jgi:hypothetical protein
MADTDITGAETTVAINSDVADNRKKIIRWVLIALVLVGAFFLVKKYILK